MTLGKVRNWKNPISHAQTNYCYDAYPFSDVSTTLNKTIILCAKPKSTSYGENNPTSNAESQLLISLQQLQEEYSQKLDLQERDLPCLEVSRE